MLSEHLAYLSDTARLTSFARAIQAAVKPGDVVVDIACGTGILGLLALEAGAARVYCIDDGPILDVAREAFRKCGRDAQARFIRGRSQHVTLPELADAAVCDNVGWFGIDYGILGLIRDARNRFLKPAAAVVPRGLNLLLAPVAFPRLVGPRVNWDEMKKEYEWLRGAWANSKHPAEFEPSDLLGQARSIAALDLAVEPGAFASWSASLVAERSGVCVGFGGWFECELGPGATMTNDPCRPDRINRPQVFLPIAQPVTMDLGDAIEVTVMARPDESILAWDASFPGGRRFQHSTAYAELSSPLDLRSRSGSRKPALSPYARARILVGQYCDGTRSVEEVEATVLRVHSDLLPSKAEIKRLVASVIGEDAP